MCIRRNVDIYINSYCSPAGSLERGGCVGSEASVCTSCFGIDRPAIMMSVVMASLLIAYNL